MEEIKKIFRRNKGLIIWEIIVLTAIGLAIILITDAYRQCKRIITESPATEQTKEETAVSTGPNAKAIAAVPGIVEVDHTKARAQKPKPDPKKEKIEQNTEQNTKQNTSGINISKSDRYALAKIAQAECETDPLRAKMLVVCVVLNRVRDPEFPSRIDEVIFQSGQFSPVENGRWESAEPDKECFYAVDAVLKGWDESEGATYFRQTSERNTWHDRALEYVTESGTTTFYRER